VIEFPHVAPEGYSYEIESFKRNVSAIWIRNHHRFSYNGGNSARSIWGFYNTNTKKYYSPINSKTVGNLVDIGNTTPYSAMVLKLTPLESAFV
jgi:hypothetical protein